MIIDEVDSILIDEARTPLIISGAAESSSKLYGTVDKIISTIKPENYEKDEKSKTVVLKDDFVEKLEEIYRTNKLLSDGSLYDINNVTLLHHTNQALKEDTFERDKDYLVQNGQVLIVDEFTGRAMEGRRFSDGLHQAIEAKENLEIQLENQTLASVTYQIISDFIKSFRDDRDSKNYDEFFDIYKLDVLQIPTNMNMVRNDHEDEIYRTLNEKYDAIVKLILKCKKKQPCLVGTVSIESLKIYHESYLRTV